MESMKTIKVAKVTLNIGTGKDQTQLEKGLALLNSISGAIPIKTLTNKRIQEWGLRPGLPIGCKVTLRKTKALELLPRLLDAVEKRLSIKQFDENGNVAFGIHEYIEIPGIKYNPKIGIMGLQVCVTLERPGYRVKKRKIMSKKIPHRHRITREEAVDFMSKNFAIKVEENQ